MKRVLLLSCTYLAATFACGMLWAQDIKALAGFQKQTGSIGDANFSLLPSDADFSWAKDHAFNVIQCNWVNDYYYNYHLSFPDICQDIEHCNYGNLKVDLLEYLNRANNNGLQVIFNLEQLLERPDDPSAGHAIADELINLVKGHPATFGYITYDEPCWKATRPEPPFQQIAISKQDQIIFMRLSKDWTLGIL